MAEHYGKDREEEHQSLHKELVVNSRYHTTYDTGESKDAECRHHRLRLAEVLVLTHEQVAEETDGYRKERDEEDVLEHSKGINLHLLACKPEHEQWRYDWCEERACRSHSYRESHVALAEIRHDIA